MIDPQSGSVQDSINAMAGTVAESRRLIERAHRLLEETSAMTDSSGVLSSRSTQDTNPSSNQG